MAPLDRFCAGIRKGEWTPRYADIGELTEAFRWSAERSVTRSATVSLLGNTYEVDPVLIGRRVELVYDPFCLDRVEVRCGGQSFGEAGPHLIGRHVHPRAETDAALAKGEPVPASGIDYTELLAARHEAELGRKISYRGLAGEANGNGSDGEAGSEGSGGSGGEADTDGSTDQAGTDGRAAR